MNLFFRRVSPFHVLALCMLLVGVVGAVVWWRRPVPPEDPFVALTIRDTEIGDEAMGRIRESWGPDSLVKSLETLPHTGYGQYRGMLLNLMAEKTGEKPDSEAVSAFWQSHIFKMPPVDPVEFNRFRVRLYDALKYPRLADYFRNDPPLTVRAEDIRWGGVDRDGIVPLRDPAMIPAGEAVYLADTDKVFGIRIGSDARAYPRRIMGHHEFVRDTIGGVRIAGVYCPLCETMIAYHCRTADGREHTFGTSGFLYRSNKLMYDEATLSLWHTLTGRPVLGSLAKTDLVLEQSPVVTTTWGEWRAANPGTVVIALAPLLTNPEMATAKYGEGLAYGQYFSTDQLMFQVPQPDGRLKNKAEVFVPRPSMRSPPVAIAAEFLTRNRIHHLTVGQTPLVVISSGGGANRAYVCGDQRFRPGPTEGSVLDQDGRLWQVTEDELRSDGRPSLPRVPGHRAFWFAWHAAYPETQLIR